MRILFVAFRFPVPPHYGDTVRAYNQLLYLKARHEVHLIAPSPPGGGCCAADMQRVCDRVTAVSNGRIGVTWRLLSRAFSGLPLQTLVTCSSAFRRAVRAELGSRKFDVVLVQLVRLAPLVRDIPEDVARVVDLVDAISLNLKRRQQYSWGFKRWLLRLEETRVRQAEHQAVGEFDQCVVSSRLDRSYIGDYENLHVIPNGISGGRSSINPGGASEPVIGFFGAMWTEANEVAVLWFARKVWPLILHRWPSARFLVVGARPSAKVRDLGKLRSVTVTGHVPDVSILLGQCQVAVAPMQSGAGIQNKVLEAMACGVPVVATDYILGGIPAVPGRHLVASNDPDGFAAGVVDLLGSVSLRRSLAIEAKQFVEREFSWAKAGANLEEVLHSAVSRRGSKRERSVNLK